MMNRRTFGSVACAAALLGSVGCGSGRDQAGAANGAPQMGPVTVELATVVEHPIDRTTEYVATIRSRRSSEIRPQVEGIITKILVRSGDRVHAGTALMQIDPAKQEAVVSSTAAQRAAQEATVRFAQQEYERQKRLFDAGLVSKQELDSAAAALDTAKASLRALEAQENEGKVQLQYYRVSAPTEGVIGDIPVRVGDRVTTATLLTTIDESSGLEVYIYVPIERAASLRPGLRVRLVDDKGNSLADTTINFVSPQVDNKTQTVLAKAPVSGHGFRTDEFVRARIVWSTEPAYTVPVLAVSRVNGQYFAYVAEKGDKGLVARQRPIKVGELVGNDYVVQDGLKSGERVVVSGVQRLADGVPITEGTSS
jgi:RND family efflux transporter MFP subunit